MWGMQGRGMDDCIYVLYCVCDGLLIVDIGNDVCGGKRVVVQFYYFVGGC